MAERHSVLETTCYINKDHRETLKGSRCKEHTLHRVSSSIESLRGKRDK